MKPTKHQRLRIDIALMAAFILIEGGLLWGMTRQATLGDFYWYLVAFIALLLLPPIRLSRRLPSHIPDMGRDSPSHRAIDAIGWVLVALLPSVMALVFSLQGWMWAQRAYHHLIHSEDLHYLDASAYFGSFVGLTAFLLIASLFCVSQSCRMIAVINHHLAGPREHR
ncbi:hypothetical protein [Halomonas elongata]|uniref:Uncharacterized protein n=1 Tax=Halomonas elongata (strain ATCC 33173 / DSM 2581 / NBRC 15536 / NCIMB 2198 / 1H9) TaxID=768066 RepID=A0ABZ0T756_HALED|nr:hypothetical protein [Halomonas elongata]WBF17656.1 hypothetical protein LM502_16505 [Halomonas elongata]WPU46495.1 hypothetical protein SR933_14735 [Halomonas elongata DSM 2581]